MAARRAPGRVRAGAFPAMEWLEEAAGALPRLMLAGGRRAMIENHTGILEFSPTRVRLMTRQGVLTISGEALLLTEIRPDALPVRGEIQSIALPAEAGRAREAARGGGLWCCATGDGWRKS
jgi:sporulation protein YqfC